MAHSRRSAGPGVSPAPAPVVRTLPATATRPAVRIRQRAQPAELPPQPSPPVPPPRRRARSQRLRQLREAHGMSVRWAKEILAGRATLEDWQSERARRAHQPAAAAAETRWLLAYGGQLAFFTYTGIRRGALAGKGPPPAYHFDLADQEALAKLDVTVVMPGEDGDAYALWACLHPEEAWHGEVSTPGLRPARRPTQRSAFPQAELEQACAQGTRLEVLTREGRRWRGRVRWDSLYAFLLVTPLGPALVLKHAVGSLRELEVSRPARSRATPRPAALERPRDAALSSPSPEHGGESRLHRCWLRADHLVQFHLPADLSREEAQRLMVWLAQLPFPVHQELRGAAGSRAGRFPRGKGRASGPPDARP